MKMSDKDFVNRLYIIIIINKSSIYKCLKLYLAEHIKSRLTHSFQRSNYFCQSKKHDCVRNYL